MESTKTKGKRNANIDLLRMIAMVMVTMLHALTKSNLLPFMGGEVSANGWIAWVLEALSVPAVNIFMLISGYFLVDSKFKLGRLAELVFQTFFYVLGTAILLFVLGEFAWKDTNIYDLLHYFLPIHMGTYWFISAYVFILLLLPLITNGIHNMSEKQLQKVVMVMLLFICVLKSILPVRLAIDERGYSFMWYLTLFLVGAEIKLYGFKRIKTAGQGWLIFAVSSFLIIAEIFLVSRIQVQTGRLKEMTMVSLDYNHVFVFFSAVGLFAAFIHAKPLKSKVGRVVCAISPYCLGVYLLQESPVMRYVWQDWFGLREIMETPVPIFLIRLLSAVIIMFVAGICVDVIRSLLFRGATYLICRRKKANVGVECDSSGV